ALAPTTPTSAATQHKAHRKPTTRQRCFQIPAPALELAFCSAEFAPSPATLVAELGRILFRPGCNIAPTEAHSSHRDTHLPRSWGTSLSILPQGQTRFCVEHCCGA